MNVLTLRIQDAAESDKLQSSEKNLKSRAIFARSSANGIIADQVCRAFLFSFFFVFRNFMPL